MSACHAVCYFILTPSLCVVLIGHEKVLRNPMKDRNLIEFPSGETESAMKPLLGSAPSGNIMYCNPDTYR